MMASTDAAEDKVVIKTVLDRWHKLESPTALRRYAPACRGSISPQLATTTVLVCICASGIMLALAGIMTAHRADALARRVLALEAQRDQAAATITGLESWATNIDSWADGIDTWANQVDNNLQSVNIRVDAVSPVTALPSIPGNAVTNKWCDDNFASK